MGETDMWLSKIGHWLDKFSNTTRRIRMASGRNRRRLELETLESRWTPATRISETQLTYQDIDGDSVTVTFSKPILTSDAAANVFLAFNTGNVNGSNTTPQQLQRIDLRGSGAAAARGTHITVEASANGGNGVADIGFIDASDKDLGKVVVDGDLARIAVGDSDASTAALKALVVGSMGALGLTTQAPGSDLHTVIRGSVSKIVVQGHINDAYIDVGIVSSAGVSKGNIGLLDVGGSVIGGSEPASGRVTAYGNIGKARIGGSVLGSAGEGSGFIFALKRIGDINIGGILQGGTGARSGSVGAIGEVGAVSIGAIAGGDALGSPSGQVSSLTGRIKSLVVSGNIAGGGGFYSGSVDAKLGLGSLTIRGSLVGGTGQFSGRVDSGSGSIGNVLVGGNVASGAGNDSGSIAARDNLGHVVVKGGIFGAQARRVIISAGGVKSLGPARIKSLTVIGDVSFVDILSGYQTTSISSPTRGNADAVIGVVNIGGDWMASNLVAGVDVGADGLFGTADDGTAVAGSNAFVSGIGPVTIGGEATGTIGDLDHFGIVAEEVRSLSVNGQRVALTPGALNDLNIALGTTGDFVLSELKA
jgi:hypothetical protein